jgi:hypothetical protein
VSSAPLPPRALALAGWIVFAAAPVLYIAFLAITWSRNIAFWDEFDTALDLLLRLDAGAGWREVVERLLAVNNEHRTVTSRLIYATSYWLAGSINFHVIAAIGNLFHVATCTLLVLAVQGWAQRLRMAVVLAFLMFQLEHFESFLWSGASIDHFPVVTLVVGSIVALAPGTRSGAVIAAGLALLATFTLAHGCLAWPIGAALLWQQRRWPDLWGWLTAGAFSAAAFLYGFEYNPGHHIDGGGASRAWDVGHYWLTLLGGPVTFGSATHAIWPGLGLLAGLAWLGWRGAARRFPVVWFTALFALGALGLVAFGRAELAGDAINSRYLVLGALGWAMLLFLVVETTAVAERPFRSLMYFVPALVWFNFTANERYAPLAETFVEARDRALTSFLHHGRDDLGRYKLHPREGHAAALLAQTEERGLYRLPRASHPASFPAAQSSLGLITYFDELLVNDRAFTAGGWAMLPRRASTRGSIYVVLQSAATTRIYSTVTLLRPDVANAYREPRWRRSGFRAVIPRDELPAEEFTVGVLIDHGDSAEYRLSRHRIDLSPGKPAMVIRATDVP